MAAQQTPWLTQEVTAAKNFFGSNPNADQIYDKANSMGLDQNQLADLWSQSGNGTYDQGYGIIGDYLSKTGKTFKGGFKSIAQQGAAQAPVTTQPAKASTPGNYNWTTDQLNSSKQFFDANKNNPSAIYNKAKELGLGSGELADLWSRTYGGSAGDLAGTIDSYASQSGLAPLVSTGLRSNPAADPRQIGHDVQAGTAGYDNPNDVAKARSVDWQVTPNQTVEGRLSGLLSQNNPLVQIAQTQGLEAANQRGLLNSSLGAEAGALAHYQYAMPIAQADANTYASSARQNASDQTNVNLANAGALNQRGSLETNFKNSMETIAVNAKNQLAQMDASTDNAIELLGPQYAQQARANYTTSLTAAMQQYQSFVNQIQLSDAPEEAKTSQIQQAQASYQNTVGFMSAMYEQMPGWSKEWSLIPA